METNLEEITGEKRALDIDFSRPAEAYFKLETLNSKGRISHKAYEALADYLLAHLEYEENQLEGWARQAEKETSEDAKAHWAAFLNRGDRGLAKALLACLRARKAEGQL